MYEFYEEPRRLNKKKIIIVSSIITIILLIIIIVLIFKHFSKPKVTNENIEEISETETIYYSNDKSVSLKLPTSFALDTYKSNSNYLLELRSKNDLNIFISKKDILENKPLSDVVEADKVAFLEDFDTCSNLSDTKELYVDNNISYTYSFHYLDKTLRKAFYLQVVWLQIENTYYVFDIDFPLDDLSFNTNVVSNVLSNFKAQK